MKQRTFAAISAVLQFRRQNVADRDAESIRGLCSQWEMPLMRDARKVFAVFAGVLVLTAGAFAQEDVNPGYLIAEAERAYPESKLPVLFGPSSLSAAFAEEADDPSWSSATEGRILDQLAEEYALGLRYKRAQVECRTATCVLLLSYVAAPAGPNKPLTSLQESLREEVGFTSAIKSKKSVMVDVRDITRRLNRPTEVLAYVEIVLRAAR